jgi:hypothetical protein
VLAIAPRRARQRLQPEIAVWFMIHLHGMHGPGVVAIVCAFAGLVAWAVAFIWEDDV